MHAPESGYTVRHAVHGDWVSYVSGLITAYCILYCYLLPFSPRAGNPRGGEIFTLEVIGGTQSWDIFLTTMTSLSLGLTRFPFQVKCIRDGKK